MSEEDAIEAWNTWKGRYKDPDLSEMLLANPCNECKDFIDSAGNYKLPNEQDMFKSIQMNRNGTMMISWPLLPPRYKRLKEDGIIHESLADLLGLRTRWCALFSNIEDYKKSIEKLLRENDHENILLNRVLLKWNKILDKRGFRTFYKNDLRGINLCGLDLSGNDYNGINLRHADLSYSDLTFAQLNGSNLYDARMDFCDAYGVSLSNCISHTMEINHSILTNSKLINTDFSQAKLFDCTLYRSILDGSDFTKASLKKINLNECSLSEYNDKKTGKSKPLIMRTINLENCSFKDILIRNNYSLIDKSIKRSIIEQNDHNTNLQELWSAIDLKPGIFGISLDVKKILKRILR
ncbi:pentapeptide repeat-containing protein [Marispirochaeta sp.]|uniref:pentapeptide repeat-containing protein n=1 Tax=Marispirochaeta sp. TaxID=2038653 RepID=UPI0029C74DDF|nr:pentapeptide repeat-containing protein [Marispirochaeta sp.]